MMKMTREYGGGIIAGFGLGSGFVAFMWINDVPNIAWTMLVIGPFVVCSGAMLAAQGQRLTREEQKGGRGEKGTS